jgi:phosphoribosylformylglycinamidine synthase
VIKAGLIESAHDVSEGGLFVTLLESCFHSGLGVDVVASDSDLRKDGYWFGEAQSRVVVSVKPAKVAAFRKLLGDHSFEELGFVTGGSIEVDGMNWGNIVSWKNRYDTAIENLLKVHESEHALSAL